jgi:hypothetical protein
MQSKPYNISESDNDVILNHDIKTLTAISQIAYRKHIPLYNKLLGHLAGGAITALLPNN